jgi:hypothetical protein
MGCGSLLDPAGPGAIREETAIKDETGTLSELSLPGHEAEFC